MKFNALRYILVVLFVGFSRWAFAQDMLAEQAPLDKQLARIDSVVLSRLLRAELYEYPADDLYPEWSNDYAHKYTNVVIPDSLLIDLTGFCMPTENTTIKNFMISLRCTRPM